MRPSITFLITNHNYEEYLSQCLESVFAQTVQDYSIVFIDDASTDGSLSVLRQVLSTPDRVSKLDGFKINEKREGVCFCRNTAMAYATGEYFVYLDADDFLLPTYVETFHQKRREFPNSFLFQMFFLHWCERLRKYIPKYDSAIRKLSCSLDVYYLAAHLGNMIYHRSCYERGVVYDNRYSACGGEDYKFFFDLLAMYPEIHPIEAREVYRVDKPKKTTRFGKSKEAMFESIWTRTMLNFQDIPELCISGLPVWDNNSRYFAFLYPSDMPELWQAKSFEKFQILKSVARKGRYPMLPRRSLTKYPRN